MRGGWRWKSICNCGLTHFFFGPPTLLSWLQNAMYSPDTVSMSKSWVTNKSPKPSEIHSWMTTLKSWRTQHGSSYRIYKYLDILHCSHLTFMWELWFHQSDFYQFEIKTQLFPSTLKYWRFRTLFFYSYRTIIESKLMSQFWSPCLVTMFDVQYFWFVLWCPPGSPSRSSYATAASGPTTPRPGVQQI